MDLFIVSLFFIPGFWSEFFYQMLVKKARENDTFYKIIRGVFFNVPITFIAWGVIWIWKTVLHNWPMISSLSEFWYKCINETFIFKYLLVLFIAALGISLLLWLIHYICIQNIKCKHKKI